VIGVNKTGGLPVLGGSAMGAHHVSYGWLDITGFIPSEEASYAKIMLIDANGARHSAQCDSVFRAGKRRSGG
jgi:hypothetical protein